MLQTTGTRDKCLQMKKDTKMPVVPLTLPGAAQCFLYHSSWHKMRALMSRAITHPTSTHGYKHPEPAECPSHSTWYRKQVTQAGTRQHTKMQTPKMHAKQTRKQHGLPQPD
jgi:hypothetical protein